MSKVIHSEVVMDDGSFIRFTPQTTGRYNHISDRFCVWGQTISFYQNFDFKNIFNNCLSIRNNYNNYNQNYKLILWKAHVAASLCSFAKELGNVFVECGVNLGMLSGCVCDFLQKVGHGKLNQFYLFDTFEGIPEEQFNAQDEPLGEYHNNKNYKKDVYSEVTDIFSIYEYVKVVKGQIPQILNDYKHIDNVSYLSLDMNILYPEKCAMEFFWDRMVKGGAVLLDDYGYAGHEKQQTFFDDFCKKINTVPCQLPTGQAIIMKT